VPEFTKELLNDVQTAQNYEWIEQNSLGTYASSTILGMNTRREHGMFVVPYDNSGKKVVLLAKLEESVFIEKHLDLFELSVLMFIPENRHKCDSVIPEKAHYCPK